MINKEVALQYVGLESVYQKAVKRFLINYKDYINELRKSESKRQLIHSLKGITLNIGAIDLYNISIEVEQDMSLIERYIEIFNLTYKELEGLYKVI